MKHLKHSNQQHFDTSLSKKDYAIVSLLLIAMLVAALNIYYIETIKNEKTAAATAVIHNN